MKKLCYILVFVSGMYGCSKKAEVVPANLNPAGDTLITLKLDPNNITYNNTYFIATDATGNVLAETKYQLGTSVYKLFTATPYSKDRVNVYELDVFDDLTAVNTVLGYLQIKKGSVYDISSSQTTSANFPLNLHLKKASGFDLLSLSTDRQGYSITSLKDSAVFKYLDYSNQSKVFAQVQKSGKTLYNFFDLGAGTHDLNIDVSQCTKVPQVKTVIVNGSLFSMQVFARPDQNSNPEYNFGTISSAGGSISYNYPAESFQQYSTVINYTNGTRRYGFVNVGENIPAQVDNFDFSFKISGSTVANVKPAISGSYNYYLANFTGNNLYVNLFSSAAANYTNLKLPDFSKYMNSSYLDQTKLILQTFGLYRVDGFNEMALPYKDYHSYHDVNMKAVEGK